MDKTNEPADGQKVVFTTENGETRLDVELKHETVWLSQKQMEQLFERDQSVISRHLRNVFKEGELEEKSNMQKMHIAHSDKPIVYYSLDAILSVGYRVNSKRGTQFRIWASQVLKQYLIEGYALNENRLQQTQEKLKQLRQAIQLSHRLAHQESLSTDESKGILAILDRYRRALSVLDDYDHQRLQIPKRPSTRQVKVTHAEAMWQILIWREKEHLGSLFGNEKDESFKSSLSTIYQTFDGAELYPSLEEKAANLLYFIVKNHSFSDGNKRIAAAMFVWFLDNHNELIHADGSQRVDDNALVAMTLLIAESRPEEKDMMVKVVVNLLNQDNK